MSTVCAPAYTKIFADEIKEYIYIYICTYENMSMQYLPYIDNMVWKDNKDDIKRLAYYQ